LYWLTRRNTIHEITRKKKQNESAVEKWKMENDEWKMSYVFKGGVPFNNLI